MVVRTFRTAFPVTSIWNPTPGDYLLVGRLAPAALDLGRLMARQADRGRPADGDPLAIPSWPGVLGYFMLGEEDTARLAEGAGLNSDDRSRSSFPHPARSTSRPP